MVKRLSNTNQNSNKLTNVPTPVDPGDAANKAYVDAQAGGGSGDVVGPSSAVDNEIARFDTGTGKKIQGSGVTISDTAVIEGVNEITAASFHASGGGFDVDGIPVVKSSTTDMLTASDTEPSSPNTGDVWIDTDNLPENLAPNTIVWKETPSGSVNGTNFQFQTSQPYVSGTLQVFLNGLAQSSFITETGAGSGVFELDTPPQTGDNIRVQYQVRSTATGNAATLNNVSMQGLLEALYPVGAVYVSGSSTMPSLISSVGTWARLKGRFIVGLDEDQTEFDTINETGGVKTHRHKGYADGDGLGNGDLRATIGSGQGAAQTLAFQALDAINPNTGGGLGNSTYTVSGSNIGSTGFSHYTKVVGYTSTQTSLPPYKAKYMWERTA